MHYMFLYVHLCFSTEYNLSERMLILGILLVFSLATTAVRMYICLLVNVTFTLTHTRYKIIYYTCFYGSNKWKKVTLYFGVGKLKMDITQRYIVYAVLNRRYHIDIIKWCKLATKFMRLTPTKLKLKAQ